MKQQLWMVEQKMYNYLENKKYETNFTLANGYRGIRGAIEFSGIGNKGNFIAGIFDKSEAQVTEAVNFQDPLVLNVYFDDEKVDFDRCSIISFERKLNMYEGVLYMDAVIKTPKGKKISISSERFVSSVNVHRWAARYKIKSMNFSGKMFLENIIDGTVINGLMDVTTKVKHFAVTGTFDLMNGIALTSRTFDKGIEVNESTKLIGNNENGNFLKSRKFNRFGDYVRELYEVTIKEGNEYVIDKIGVTFSSRDIKDELKIHCEDELANFYKSGFDNEKEVQLKYFKDLWNKIDIEIEGDDVSQIGIRFNLFHLSTTAYEKDGRVSIAAKGLHGEGYKGHVFWDTETFMLPFFIYSRPEVAKSLLMYRYNTLSGARENARLNGYEGAQFPWESADDGLEVTPKWGFDYDGKPVRIWTGDEEFHINSDITFGIWEYYRATLDKGFLINYGLEIFFDTAKFWVSRVEYNCEEDRYEISKVIGPDEFHEHVDNNVYTNYLTKWSLKKSYQLAEWIKREDRTVYDNLCNKLGLSDKSIETWRNIETKIYIPMSKDGKLIEQFEGYFDMPDAVITEYDENGMPLWPELNGIKFNDTQLIKQADVVMLLLMLGDEFDEKTKKANYQYYEKRTMHKSSLSPSIYSIVGLSIGDTHNAYKYFRKAILTDLEDNQGNTDFGIHAASTGGSWQSAVFGFSGLFVDSDLVLNINPWIPEVWKSFTVRVNWQNELLTIKTTDKYVEIKSTGDSKVKVFGKQFEVCVNNTIKIDTIK